MIGTLETVPALSRPDLLAQPVIDALETHRGEDVLVAQIDPDLADTAAFCERYRVPLEISANCVVVAGKREGTLRVAAWSCSPRRERMSTTSSASASMSGRPPFLQWRKPSKRLEWSMAASPR